MAFNYYHWLERLEAALNETWCGEACAQSGSVDAEVDAACSHPAIRRVLDELDENGGEGNEVLASRLAEYGAWDADERLDQDANKQRIVWVTACDMRETREAEARVAKAAPKSKGTPARQAAEELVAAFARDVLTGDAPGITLADMIETLLLEREG